MGWFGTARTTGSKLPIRSTWLSKPSRLLLENFKSGEKVGVAGGSGMPGKVSFP
jgi:hypothetical protein